MIQLKNIHLYGRHLVCEYAEIGSDMSHNQDNLSNSNQNSNSNSNSNGSGSANQDINILRKKAKRDMSVIEQINSNSNNKKSKIDEGGDGLDIYTKGSMSNVE